MNLILDYFHTSLVLLVSSSKDLLYNWLAEYFLAILEAEVEVMAEVTGGLADVRGPGHPCLVEGDTGVTGMIRSLTDASGYLASVWTLENEILR